MGSQSVSRASSVFSPAQPAALRSRSTTPSLCSPDELIELATRQPGTSRQATPEYEPPPASPGLVTPSMPWGGRLSGAETPVDYGSDSDMDLGSERDDSVYRTPSAQGGRDPRSPAPVGRHVLGAASAEGVRLPSPGPAAPPAPNAPSTQAAVGLLPAIVLVGKAADDRGCLRHPVARESVEQAPAATDDAPATPAALEVNGGQSYSLFVLSAVVVLGAAAVCARSGDELAVPSWESTKGWAIGAGTAAGQRLAAATMQAANFLHRAGTQLSAGLPRLNH